MFGFVLIYSIRKVHKSGSWVVGLTALSESLLRRRFLICGMTARVARRWDSYLEYYTSYLAPMGTASFYKSVRFVKDIADSGTDSFMEY